jgi:hypothetical protein
MRKKRLVKRMWSDQNAVLLLALSIVFTLWSAYILSTVLFLESVHG